MKTTELINGLTRINKNHTDPEIQFFTEKSIEKIKELECEVSNHEKK